MTGVGGGGAIDEKGRNEEELDSISKSRLDFRFPVQSGSKVIQGPWDADSARGGVPRASTQVLGFSPFGED